MMKGMIETGGGQIQTNIFTDDEVDKAVKQHNLFPNLTLLKEQRRASLNDDKQILETEEAKE